MANSIKLDPQEWRIILNKLREEYGNVVAISWVSKDRLGFTSRRHLHYCNETGGLGEVIYLDFYDDAMETMFRLKYL